MLGQILCKGMSTTAHVMDLCELQSQRFEEYLEYLQGEGFVLEANDQVFDPERYLSENLEVRD